MADLNLSMFRAYDIRTPSESLTQELAARLARAEAVYFSEELGVRGVLLAHDARSSGPEYLELGAVEFARAGLKVVVIPHVCSTSQFYFAAMCYPEYAGVMYGASHNPAADTGQKILGPGVRPIAEHIGPRGGLDRIKELYQAAAAPESRTRPAAINALDPTEDYIRYSMALAGVEPESLQGVNVLHDYLNGAAGREMMLAFGRAGASVTPLHFPANGQFPLGDPNPVKHSVIREGIEALKTGDQLLGCFFDGDGDRIDFYRGDGAYLSSSFVYAGILPLIKRRFPNQIGVFADLKSNPLAIMQMAGAGVRVNVIRNGHSQIKNSMFEDREMVGTVEESAHFYESFPPPNSDRLPTEGARAGFATENTLYVALLVTKAWKENPGRFDELFSIQARTSREREWGYRFPSDELRARALEAVRRSFEVRGAAAMTRMPNGYELEATLMRKGLPFAIDENTRFSQDWLQISQRVSQSENGLARWEVVAARPDIAAEAKQEIGRIVREFGAGEEYQG